MNFYSVQGGTSSTEQSMFSDLDGYSFPVNYCHPPGGTSYLMPPENDEFGFDPPTKTSNVKHENISRPTNPSKVTTVSGWPAVEHEEDNQHYMQVKSSPQLLLLRTQALSQDASTLSRFGQITPPISNSGSSVEDTDEAGIVSPKPGSPSARRKGMKGERTAPTSAKSKPARKPKSYRESHMKIGKRNDVDNEKRKVLLEKNRLAAAKCRVSRKEKTEKLQRDSLKMAVHNAFLKDMVVRLRDEIQHMNALLIAHSSSDGCKKPDELRRHVSQVLQDYFSINHIGMQGQAYSTYARLARQLLQQDHQGNNRDSAIGNGYFSAMANSNQDPSLLSDPPLPEFNPSADFDDRTPPALQS